MHPHRNAPAALLLIPCILLAEPPVEWRAELSSGEVETLYASHGDTRAIECRLFLKGSPYTPELAAFRYSTNGFAGAGWEAPVALSSNLASVAWSPALDPGADMLALLLTLDGTHTAKALLHLRPGPAPGDALPPPTRILDFAAQPYTNAPWALPGDLAGYATTGYVAAAVASIDLSAYATNGHVHGAADVTSGTLDAARIPNLDASKVASGTFDAARIPGSIARTAQVAAAAAAATNYTDEAIAALAPGDAGEYAREFHDYILAEPVYLPADADTYYDFGGEVWSRTYTATGFRSIRLSAWREDLSGTPTSSAPLPGTWAVEAGADFATLSGSVLSPTGAGGPVAVRFDPADGSESVRRTVSMRYIPAEQRVVAPFAEVSEPSVWRYRAGDALRELFHGAPPSPASSYRHGRGGAPDTWCDPIPDALQLYTTAEVRNPGTVNDAFFSRALADLLRCQSVGRTDFYTGPDTRPALFITPHYALCATHYIPRTARFCISRDGGGTFADYAFAAVKSWGDLTVLRSDAAFPEALLPALVSNGTLRAASASGYAAGLAVYQSQHGTVHPCLVSPLSGGTGWTTCRVGDRSDLLHNETWIATGYLPAFGHDVHGGDSGHAVCLVAAGRLVPVGLYCGANGGGESLCSDKALQTIAEALAGSGESPRMLTLEELLQQP